MTAPRVALIVIDMQMGMSSHHAPERNNPDAETHVRALSAHGRARPWPVVHVRHIPRTPGSPFWPGQPGVEFQPALVIARKMAMQDGLFFVAAAQGLLNGRVMAGSGRD